MMRKIVTSLYPFCYRVLMTLVLYTMTVGMTGKWLEVENPGVLHGIVALWAALLLTVISMGKFYQKMLSIFILVLSAFVMIPLMETAGFVDFYRSYFTWLEGGAGFRKEWLLSYELLQIFLLTIVCFIVQLVLEKNRKLKGGAALILFAGLIVSMIINVRLSRMGMVGAVAFILIILADNMRKFCSTKKKHDERAYLVFLTPYIVLYIVIMSMVPIREEPYDWKLVKDIYRNLREKTITLWENITRNDEEFDDMTVGFSESPWLANRLIKSDRQVMTVVGDRNLLTDIYLRGKTYDRFSNCRWEETIGQKADEYPIDILELVYGVRRYDKDWQRNYIRRSNLKIRYEYFNTIYAFAPGKMQGILNREYKEAGDVMHFPQDAGYGTEYEVSFFQMNYGVPEFVDFIESVSELPDDEEAFEEGELVLPLDIRAPYTLEDLEKYRSKMQAQYGEEIIPGPQVQKYIDKITKDCTTKWQRLKAIEAALQRMQYTAEPGNIPKSVKSPEDYLEYFLLESRKGYCAHYATAFVLLARAEGLPARYVEGFKIPFNISRNIRVYSSMAHAWPEVYLEGVGWVAFEPTPGFADYANNGWKVQKPEDYDGEIETTPIRNAPNEFSFEDEEEFIEEPEAEDNPVNVRRLLVILYGVLILPAACLVIFLINLFLGKIRYFKMSDQEKFLTDVRKNLWLLEKIGYKRLPSETLDELEQRISRDAPHLCGSLNGFMFIRVYQEYIYRTENIENELLKTALTERKQILDFLKEQNGWYWFWLKVALGLWVEK